MKLHLLGFPHTQANPNFNVCAYTGKIYKFLKMFPDAFFYGNEGSVGGQVVPIFSYAEQEEMFGKIKWYKEGRYYEVSYDSTEPHWVQFNARAVEEISKRIQPGDLILSFAGLAQKSVADAFPNNYFIEAGIGYEGIFSHYKVFESAAWMHYMYGKREIVNGNFYDCVIPNYYDVSEFPFCDSADRDDYLLFVGRPIDRKGINVIRDIARAGHRVIAAGAEELSGENIEWVGYADSKKRGELMSKAKALLCPTIYIGPFEGVAVEAMMCGTPIITTDWGVFRETNVHGKTGFRCRTLGEFLAAVQEVDKLNHDEIRNRAIAMYGLESVALQYQAYFNQIATLPGKGWYETEVDVQSFKERYGKN